MREILFRGKRADNGEWVEGYYVVDPLARYRIYLQPFPEATSNTHYFVDPETVGQFTGLFDKNGTKIFEGDIIAAFGSKISIEHFRGAFGYFTGSEHYESFHSIATHSHIAIIDNTLTKIPVIGNIHDNPELINK